MRRCAGKKLAAADADASSKRVDPPRRARAATRPPRRRAARRRGRAGAGTKGGETMGGEDKYDQPMWSAVLAGTIGGGVAVVVGYPFETVKVRLQTGTTRHLFRDLFAGVTAPLTTVTPAWAIMYAAYYGAQSWLATKAHWELSPVAKGAVSGALCGFATAAVTVPTDVVKINAQRMHCSAPEAFRKLLSKGGPGFLVHGGVATAVHLTASQAIFFGTYEYALSRLASRAAPAAPAAPVPRVDYAPAIAGGLSGVMEWTCCMSSDSVKTRYQSGPMGASYVGVWRSVYATEGPRGFYRGYAPVILRAVPVNASTFFVIEYVNDAIRRHLVEEKRRNTTRPAPAAAPAVGGRSELS